MNGMTLKNSVKLSDLMEGTSIEFTSSPGYNEDEYENLFWNEDQKVEDYKNPCETSFSDWRATMTEISEDLYKKIQIPPRKDAKQVDINRQRIKYHRNMYFDLEEQPFDSTYLNGKYDEICVPMENKLLLEGFLEALSTMKEGEKSLFLIGYKKMFKEHGCPPRVQPKADVLCELEVLKLEDVGDQEIIDKLETGDLDKFSEIKKSLEEIFVRASDYFSQKKFKSAIKGYRRILQAATYSVTTNDQEKQERDDILKRVNLNLAVCSNKNEDYRESLEYLQNLEQITSIDNHPKALYTKGVALMKLGELNEAVAPITKALKLSPLNDQIIQAVEELDKRKKIYQEEKKKFAMKLGFQ